MKLCFIGASGYGNTGDDTYPLLFSKYLAQHELIFKNSDKPRNIPSGVDYVIFGGGGIIYDNNTAHFDYMNEYYKDIKRKGIPYSFISCGIQIDNKFNSLNRWSEILNAADTITLRSSMGVEILKKYTNNKNITYYPDLCYLFDGINNNINLPKKYNLFIPISYSCIELWKDKICNDKTQSIIISMGNTQLLKKRLKEKINCKYNFVESVNPSTVRYIIMNATKIYTSRYHGMVFSRSLKKEFEKGGKNSFKMINEDMHSNVTTSIEHINTLKKIISKK